jgi:hypothetical protein
VLLPPPVAEGTVEVDNCIQCDNSLGSIVFTDKAKCPRVASVRSMKVQAASEPLSPRMMRRLFEVRWDWACGRDCGGVGGREGWL